MASYHINGKGEPGLCRAQRACPFGPGADHYDTASQAREAFEQSMASSPMAAVKKVKTDYSQDGDGWYDEMAEWAMANEEGQRKIFVSPESLLPLILHQPYAPRKALGADVAAHGIKAPIPVALRPGWRKDGTHSGKVPIPRMADGHHRLKAAMDAGLTKIPVELFGPYAYKALDAKSDKDTNDGIDHWRDN